jgi:hypothetical protein
MKDSFAEFHRLIAEANQLIEQVTQHPDDSEIRIKQLHVVHALIEAQRFAIQLESLLTADPTIPTQ